MIFLHGFKAMSRTMDGYSELDELTLEKFNDHKYHASLKFGRYQADGTLIGNYKSLTVIFREGRWGITGGSGSGWK